MMLDRFEQFTGAISGIYRDIQKIQRDEMEKHGLKGAYAQYLLVLDHYRDGVSSAELCELCDKDKAAVSRVVSELEEKGLLQKESRQYRSKLCLTEKGRQIAQYVEERAELAVAIAGKGLTEEQRQNLYSALDTISANLRTVCREGLKE